jgi:NAD(P)-dependent dehydrogenase (short-subunit alcohol dehydrogenase family)
MKIVSYEGISIIVLSLNGVKVKLIINLTSGGIQDETRSGMGRFFRQSCSHYRGSEAVYCMTKAGISQLTKCLAL